MCVDDVSYGGRFVWRFVWRALRNSAIRSASASVVDGHNDMADMTTTSDADSDATSDYMQRQGEPGQAVSQREHYPGARYGALAVVNGPTKQVPSQGKI